MTSMQTRICDKVIAGITPYHIEIINESDTHSGPATESHFNLVLVSERFNELNAVKRHQLVYGLLADELRDGVHALAMHLYSPREWAELEREVPESPDCRGGGGQPEWV